MWVAAVVVALVAGVAVRADAAPRKRVVVLDFTGPKADKFHDDVVRLVKKSYTLVPTDKWTGTADELGATKPTDANVAKIAKKLKIDGIIIGKVEKRRDDYLVHVKLRSGKTGAIANSADTKSTGPRLDAKSSSDIKDELIDAIGQLGVAPLKGDDDSGDSGDDDSDDSDAKPAKPAAKKPAAKKPGKSAAADDDDDDADAKPAKPAAKKPAAKKPAASDDDDDDDTADAKPTKSGFGKRPAGKQVAAKKPAASDDDDDSGGAGKAPDASHDDDDSPLKGAKKAPAMAKKPPDDGSEDKSDGGGGADGGDGGGKKVASADAGGEDDGGGVTKSSGESGSSLLGADVALSPGHRAIDASLGLSLVSRQLGFTHSTALTNAPPGYRGALNPGAVLDVEVYPLAIGHKSSGGASNLGLMLVYDKVLAVTSGATYKDANNASQTAVLPTSAGRYQVGVVFRHPFGTSATSPVIGASLSYGNTAFTINTTEPNNMTADIPSVSYSMIEPALRFNLPVSAKLGLLANVGAQVVTNAGQISQMDQYGQATVLGIDVLAGGDYMVTSKIFARATFNLDTIGFTFKGNGTLSNNRDNNPQTQDVFGARDSYYRVMLAVGYLY